MHIAIEIKFLHAKIFHGCKKLKSGATKLEALYTAVIHNQSRECEFTKAEASQPIHCCLCYPSTPGPPLWNCITTTPSLSLLPSGQYSIAVSTCTYKHYPQLLHYHILCQLFLCQPQVPQLLISFLLIS